MPTKREVRHQARGRRRELVRALEVPGARGAAGLRIARQVLTSLPVTRSGGLRVAAYESLPDEPPTGPLIEALIAAGHQVIVPITLEDFSLDWRIATVGSVGDQATVTRAPLPPGVAALGPEAPASCDLIIIPGLSVDPHGVRLGQGGGCYDRALIHREPRTPVVTLLHEGEQSLEPLPRSAHDQLVDGYLTTSGRLVWVDPDGAGRAGRAGDNAPQPGPSRPAAGRTDPATGSKLREG